MATAFTALLWLVFAAGVVALAVLIVIAVVLYRLR
jgi:hypothetical protein